MAKDESSKQKEGYLTQRIAQLRVGEFEIETHLYKDNSHQYQIIIRDQMHFPEETGWVKEIFIGNLEELIQLIFRAQAIPEDAGD
jgi:hypothetical protein